MITKSIQHSAQVPTLTDPIFGFDNGLFELPGKKPLWIWAHACPNKNCDCRNVFVIATEESRDALLTRGLPVHEAWQANTGYVAVTAQLEEFTPFYMDIDTLGVSDPSGKPLKPVEVHPHITAIIERMDSDILDAIAMLWYTAKGHPDPREKVLGAQSISIPLRGAGDMVPYSDIFNWVRSDIYSLDDEAITAFEALDIYCINPECDCGEVIVLFHQLTKNKPQPVGIVDVNLSGAIVLKPEQGQEKTLNLLWAAFRKRHPAYLARFARRDADMKLMGAKVKPQTTVNSSPKVGRNEPCPCGSGKKYKKCCWV